MKPRRGASSPNWSVALNWWRRESWPPCFPGA